jgi:single-stranded DNA-binding protein
MPIPQDRIIYFLVFSSPTDSFFKYQEFLIIMNSCILMATVIGNPELRYTQENQTAIAQMLVEFQGGKPEDPPSTLKVIGWGNLATEIQESYTIGDRIVIEGRLKMDTIERPEGFKEKRAELVAGRIHRLEGSAKASGTVATAKVVPIATTEPKNVVNLENYKSSAKPAPVQAQPEPQDEWSYPSTPASTISDSDLDEIPF